MRTATCYGSFAAIILNMTCPLPRGVHGQSLNDRAPRFTFHATRKRPEGPSAAPNWHRDMAFLPGKPGMIPISDDNPVDHTPFMTWLLILACVAAFAWEISLGEKGMDAAL